MEYGAAPMVELFIVALLVIVPLWRVFHRAGFAPALSLLVIAPLLGALSVLAILAFAEWPALKRRTTAAIASTFE